MLKNVIIHRYNTPLGALPSRGVSQLPPSFAQKIKGRQLPIIMHPRYSEDRLFVDGEATSRAQAFTPELEFTKYEEYIGRIAKKLTTLNAVGIFAGVDEEEFVECWIKALKIQAEVLWVTTCPSDPLPFVAFSREDFSKAFSAWIGQRWERVWNASFCSTRTNANGHLFLETAADGELLLQGGNKNEDQTLSFLLRNEAYRRLARLLRRSGAKEIELWGELAMHSERKKAAKEDGCVIGARDEFFGTIPITINRSMVFPGFEYTERNIDPLV